MSSLDIAASLPIRRDGLPVVALPIVLLRCELRPNEELQ